MLGLASVMQEVTRRRESPGQYVNGIWIPGVVATARMLVSVQPLTFEDSDAVDTRLLSRLRLYAQQSRSALGRGGFQSAGFGLGFQRFQAPTVSLPLFSAGELDVGADKFEVDGRIYTVERVVPWKGFYVMAVCVYSS